MLDEFEYKLADEETRLRSQISSDSESEAAEKVPDSPQTGHRCGKCSNCTKGDCGRCAVCRNDVDPYGELVSTVCLQKVCQVVCPF